MLQRALVGRASTPLEPEEKEKKKVKTTSLSDAVLKREGRVVLPTRGGARTKKRR